MAQRQKSTGSRLAYQPHEHGSDGPHLLYDPLDPELQKIDADARKFRVPRSLRDVEPPVNLWVKTLDNVAVDAATEEGS